MRILVVEDERNIALAIKKGLEIESYAVDIELDGLDGYNAASTEDYDLIILDVMLPSMDGFEICSRLRKEGSHAPVLMLTAKDQDSDVVRGLDLGADDYLAKPFSFEVLVSRVRSLLRRPKEAIPNEIVVGDLILDTVSKSVTRNGNAIMLSSKEFAILEYMMRNNGVVLSKEKIISHVWDFDSDILPNTVEVFMNYLRTKIDKPYKNHLFHTVRGFGYKIEAQ
jgi:DNA-binding response OmpR family regulator